MNALQKSGYLFARIAAPLVIVAVGVGGLLVFGQRPPKQTQPETRHARTVVEVVPARSFEGVFTIEVEGVALPLRQVQTSAQVSGLVTRKDPRCRGGRYVEAGEVLIEIDTTDYQLERERLEAQLEQADENLAESAVAVENTNSLIELAMADLSLQQRNLARVQEVFDRGASTDTTLDEARKQELASRNALQSLKNELRTRQQQERSLVAGKKLAAAQLKQAAANVARTKIAAPVSGTIITTDVEEGDYVKVGDPLFRTNDTDDMEVSCQLRVDELYWIWLQAGTFSTEAKPTDATFEIPNTPVQVAFEFKGAEYLWDGELSRYEGGGLDASTRTVPCRVLVREPTDVRIGEGVRGMVAPPTLFSGMYVKVRLPIDPPIPLVEVPTSAVQPGGEVWLVREGALVVEPVEVARVDDSAALLVPSPNGPRPGELVIVSPLAGPSPGMPVEPVAPGSPLERARIAADGAGAAANEQLAEESR